MKSWTFIIIIVLSLGTLFGFSQLRPLKRIEYPVYIFPTVIPVSYKSYKLTPSPVITSLPEPTPIIFTAQKDTVFRIKHTPSFEILIPKGAELESEYGMAKVTFNNGLKIIVCDGCQNFVPNCGGLSDGNPQEGGCVNKPIDIGEYKMTMHYRDGDLGKIQGYTDYPSNFEVYSDKFGKIEVTVQIRTDDYRLLTESDKSALLPILRSIK